MIPFNLAFIGAGNMTQSLLGGLVKEHFKSENIHISDTDPEKLSLLERQYGVQTFSDNVAAIENCSVVIVAVKPQQLQKVIRQLAPAWQSEQLLISIAAGVTSEDIERWLNNPNAAVVRTMPNTPALVQAGATGLYANQRVNERQRDLAESILRAVGLTVWVAQEKQLDAVTAVSGSGPAYFFLVMEAMEIAAIELGLDADTARLLCRQTALGAAKLALESSESVASLRRNVTSPGGTTERAINKLQDGGLIPLFEGALIAAALRSRELAVELGKDHAE